MTQQEALDILKTGANVFLTGEPGSGKTHTVNEYVAYLRARGVEPAVTASTGIAATHIGGMTVHSWSGIGVKRSLSAYDLDQIAQRRPAAERIMGARTLIIDEISMLSSQTLNMVNAVCKEIRRSSEPFGGMQIILVGDFFQLPPVIKQESDDTPQLSLAPEDDKNIFAFDSSAWRSLLPVVCYLSEQYRQEDGAFLDLLSAIRRGTVDESHKDLLAQRQAKAAPAGVTKLYAHNADVDRINDAELTKLNGREERFEMLQGGSEKLAQNLKRGCLSPEVLKLKKGARVMFTRNDAFRHRFVNGTLGTVEDFAKETRFPVVRTLSGTIVLVEPEEWRMEDAGRVLARITQIPLRLAWAMTVHKSQGLSLDAAHMDLSGVFEYGQGYVALSRVRTLRGLSLGGINTRALEVHPAVCAKDAEFRNASQDAREAFSRMSAENLAQMHANFIRACGGMQEAPAEHEAAPKARVPRASTCDETKSLLLQKLPLEAMAKKRNLTQGTILSHLEKLAAQGQIDPAKDLAHLKRGGARFERMERAFKAVYAKEKRLPLAPAHALLGGTYSFDELRLARLFVSVP